MYLLQTLVSLAVTLGILVTVHEWGHFFVARRCGVKVLRFSVGFGKPLFSWRDKQNTEYVVAAIPLGGYVKMLDEREGDVPDDQLQYAFNRKPVLQRIAVVAAGPLVNLLFAVLAYWVLFVSGVSVMAPIAADPKPGSLVAQTELREQGEILSIDGVPTYSWEDVNLRLAGLVGETGPLTLRVRYPDSTLPEEYTIELNAWEVDLEKESPVSALGLRPWRPDVPPVIGRLVEGGVAERTGLQQGDRIVQLNGEAVDDWLTLVDAVKHSPGQPLEMVLLRDGVEVAISITPAIKEEDDGRKIGFIGAGVEPFEWPPELQRTLQYGVLESLLKGFEKTYQMISLTLDSIWKMLEGVVSVKNLSGPITIAQVASASASSGFETFVNFLAYLSISLGVLNLLPIPVLDGGHLVYYFAELVRGKPISERVQQFGFRIGVSLLAGLMVLAMVNDLARL